MLYQLAGCYVNALQSFLHSRNRYQRLLKQEVEQWHGKSISSHGGANDFAVFVANSQNGFGRIDRLAADFINSTNKYLQTYLPTTVVADSHQAIVIFGAIRTQKVAQ